MHPVTFPAGIDLHTLPLGTVLPRIGAALAVGVALGFRPWRLLMGRRLPRPEMAQAQILLCAAAAIITMVIGDSVAKAFGLVGLGSFVRFRSGLKDPRDAAVLFLTIGLGMACGHGTLGLALTAGLAASAVLAALDLLPAGEPADADAAARAAGAPAAEVAPPRLADASRKSP
ncbi:DUF4956 domain-containing protein [Anaeromyxobacter sp. PSR-1]|uniref:DUF4956 domain-containing protein n=1 Tax=unclassified Anaeromyxobacter TaxID=2620896 RepID=UPI0005DFB40D|nr:DUF4956 domain-containing protein [Anaeromyxobacter sp. PSR-1]GAO05567.1 hypothetical protein PSR1_04481 [Anaeromyxobacter sp. PSR-1]